MNKDITIEYILEKYQVLFKDLDPKTRPSKAKDLRTLLYSLAEIAVEHYFQDINKNYNLDYNKDGIAVEKLKP